jgi:hypothetical protein
VGGAHRAYPRFGLGCRAVRVAHVPDDATDPARPEPDEGVIDAAQDALNEVRDQLLQYPAEGVVANHAIGLYELGAIHLSAQPPNLVDAALAIDALACLVEGLGDRLGEQAPVLRDALANIRLAFVQVKGSV